jgi:hypothetical protein
MDTLMSGGLLTISPPEAELGEGPEDGGGIEGVPIPGNAMGWGIMYD